MRRYVSPFAKAAFEPIFAAPTMLLLPELQSVLSLMLDGKKLIAPPVLVLLSDQDRLFPL